MFFKIGEENTDSVFTRSFSFLVITGVLTKDRQIKVLADENIKHAFKESVNYLQNERDTRGYVEEKGWAHSVAHEADLLESLVRHPKMIKENFDEILNTIHNCLFKDATYIDDERLIFVIEAFIDRGLNEKILEQWVIKIWNELELIYSKEGFSNRYFRTKFNITNFLKTVYFRIGFKDDNCKLRELINDKLKELYQKVYG